MNWGWCCRGAELWPLGEQADKGCCSLGLALGGRGLRYRRGKRKGDLAE